MISELLTERSIQEQKTQLSIAMAGSGWSGEAAKEMFGRLDEAQREITEHLNGVQSESSGEPKPKIPLSEDEFRRQVGA